MSKARPFLGETTDRNAAFPGIAAIDMVVAQDPRGLYGKAFERRYTKATLPRMETCANGRCCQGGMDLQAHVLHWGPGEAQFHSNGHEGTPQGRKVGAPCSNTFKIKLDVTKD